MGKSNGNWTSAESFISRIDRREIRLCIIGLGYVGLPLALKFAEKGVLTYGFDIDAEKINKLRDKINCLPQEEWLSPLIERYVGETFIPVESLAPYTVAFIDVPTPYDKVRGEPVYDYVVSAAKSVGKTIKSGSLVVLESTVGPGFTKGLFKDILESESQLKAGEDFGLAFSPERVNPGDPEHRLYNTAKVVAGYEKLSTDLTAYLYEQIVPHVYKLSDPSEGEMTKLLENMQRDTNIALMNELAKACDYLGIDIAHVIDAASTKWDFLRIEPGCGVGGHCLPHDPYFLLNEIPNLQPSIIRSAREVNDSMPSYTVDKALSEIEKNGKDLSDSKVAVLGLSYKKNMGDPRTPPAEKVIEELRQRGVEPIAYDPYIERISWASTASLDEVLANVDAVILCTAHDEFNDLPEKIAQFAPGSIFIDGRNKFEREDFESRGIRYMGMGR